MQKPASNNSFKPKEEEEEASDPDPDPVDLLNQLVPQPPPRRSASGSTAVVADNVEAERRKRERLDHGFIHLSSLLPDLKKSDKASVLEEAASYVKKLQVRMKSLEEQTSTRASTSIAKVGRHRSSSIDDTYSSDLSPDNDFGISKSSSGGLLLEVEARISNKEVLIKVHCHRNLEMVSRVLEEINKLNLNIINCNSMDFGQYEMVITILAKMSEGFSITAKDLVRMLQQSLQG